MEEYGYSSICLVMLIEYPSCASKHDRNYEGDKDESERDPSFMDFFS